MAKGRYRLEFPLESFLTSGKEIGSQDKGIRLVPNPDRNNLLDKGIVEIEARSMEQAWDEAHDTLSGYLSILSYEYDCPIRISDPPSCHEISPAASGRTTRSVSQTARAYIAGSARIDRLPDVAKYQSMQVALACYREARSSTNEFHQYLNYYKVIENLLDAKGTPGKKGKKTVDVLHEKLNEVGVTIDSKRISQDQAKEIYKDSRCALAHAGKQPTLTRDRIRDVRRVRKGVPVIKDIARQCLEWKKRSLEASP